MVIERRRLLKIGIKIKCYLGEIAKMEQETPQLSRGKFSKDFLAYNF